MKTLLMFVLLVAFATPGTAQRTMPSSQVLAERYAVMINYDTQCGGLSAKTKEMVDIIGTIVDQPLFEAELAKAIHLMLDMGKHDWCATARPWVLKVEDAAHEDAAQ